MHPLCLKHQDMAQRCTFSTQNHWIWERSHFMCVVYTCTDTSKFTLRPVSASTEPGTHIIQQVCYLEKYNPASSKFKLYFKRCKC